MAVADAPNVTARQLQFVCRWILECVTPLSEEQLRFQAIVTAPSIRFHLFHIARCADIMLWRISETAEQVWAAENVAAKWGLDKVNLGLGEMGATLEASEATHLPLPDKPELLAYAERILAETDRTLSCVDDAEFQRVVTGYQNKPMMIGEMIVDQLEHLGRHLGMIEAMRGIQGMDGTATI